MDLVATIDFVIGKFTNRDCGVDRQILCHLTYLTVNEWPNDQIREKDQFLYVFQVWGSRFSILKSKVKNQN